MLDRLYRPRGVAVIGASNKELSIGYRVVRNILKHGFKGQLYPVNPKDAEIQGLPAYKSVGDIPGDVDLCNIVIKNSFCPMAVEDCGKKGVKFVILHTAGFRESGEEGAKLEDEILAIARKYGMRIYGPNAQGVMNSDPEVSLYANFTFTPMTPSGVSILAQSGGVAEVLNLNLRAAGLGFRMYASPGNAADLGIDELLEYFGKDEGTRAILMHIESLSDPQRFAEIASAITREKPILALKSGSTEAGATAVSSHTGSLASPDKAMDALFERCGVMRFFDEREMIEAAVALSTQPPPPGKRVAMITNAGGPAIIAIDESASRGLALAELSEQTQQAIAEKAFGVAHIGNPVDLAATANPEHYGNAVRRLLDDDGVDAVIVNMITPFFVDNQGIATQVVEQSKGASKPVLPVLMTIETWDDVRRILREGGLPVYEYPEAAARALAQMLRWRAVRDRPEYQAPQVDVDRKAARAIADKHTGSEAYLPFLDAMAMLDAYGIPTAPSRAVDDEAALKAAVKELGAPLALKIDSPEVIHKSDAGGVALNLNDEAAAIAAFNEMKQRFAEVPGTIVAQAMAPPGQELICGAAGAGDVGTTVLFGLGGILVEVLQDVALGLAPLSTDEAAALIRSVKAFPVLQGVRGQAGVDLDALADLLVRLSVLVADLGNVAEMDCNPVLAYPEGRAPVVVDVRIRLG